MSNALAIATVTETLLEVLNNALAGSPVTGAIVTALRPDDPSFQGGAQKAGVNIFLYQVSPNPSLRNADLPTRRADGTLLRRPQVALDLHYLFTFYGEDAKYEQQRLLGAVVRQFHAAPVLTRDAVSKAETNASLASNLAEQIDLVRLTPINFSLEEMSKLWSVFLKTDYALSIAYVASVVLIETDDPPPAGALPVLEPRVQAIPFSLAVIDTIDPQAVASSPPGPLAITLRGQGLDLASVVAFTTPGKADPISGTIGSGSTTSALDVTLPAGLRPGVNTVQLVQLAPPTSPPETTPHVLSQSNVAPFLILPALVNISPPALGELTATVWPAVGPQQQVSLVLNQLTGSPASDPQAFVLPADAHPAETDTFSFSTSFPNGTVPAGSYLVRVRVDGAESRLTTDPSGGFDGPLVNIP
jgi:hypothetical protein